MIQQQSILKVADNTGAKETVSKVGDSDEDK